MHKNRENQWLSEEETASVRSYAPELFKALLDIIDCCNESHAERDYVSRQTEILGIARYAINNATGKNI